MRYTTVIDISELKQLYRNVNTRLLYLHLALKSGYHDEDRDLIKTSIRRLAAESGLTVSAVRNSLKQLCAAGLTEQRGDKLFVKKWILDTPPTPRTRKDKAQAVKGEGNIGKRLEAEQQDYQRRVLDALRQCDRAEVESWLSEIEGGKSIRHHGVYLNANRQNADWLRQVLAKMPITDK